jgi:hypothetical protein
MAFLNLNFRKLEHDLPPQKGDPARFVPTDPDGLQASVVFFTGVSRVVLGDGKLGGFGVLSDGVGGGITALSWSLSIALVGRRS